jgi:hypothetical protein
MGQEKGAKPPALMEMEDQLFSQMQAEFRGRLERHLQETVASLESQMPEVPELTRRRTVGLSLISTFGVIRLQVVKGYSLAQKKWLVPIRQAWGLADNQRISPSLQRKLCSTAVATGSFEKAALLAGEWGCAISDDAIRSCVVSLGMKALKHPSSSILPDRAGADDVLIIMMDGWMARHRGKHWGRKRRAKGQERVQWHEIKSAVIYRLRDQATVSPQRRALLSKHVVAVPATTDPVDFGRRVQDEARRMGLAEARQVYVVMDGGVWLWHIFEDRFKICATGSLDFYHASEHLHALAAELFGDSQEARTWSHRILHSLKHHSPRKLFKTLADLMADPPPHDEKTRSAIHSANEYFASHKDHMNYAQAAKAGLPIGSGSMESQCSQFQNRLKRRGQFWSHKGFSAILEVAVRYQNGEILSLWAA